MCSTLYSWRITDVMFGKLYFFSWQRVQNVRYLLLMPSWPHWWLVHAPSIPGTLWCTEKENTCSLTSVIPPSLVSMRCYWLGTWYGSGWLDWSLLHPALYVYILECATNYPSSLSNYMHNNYTPCFSVDPHELLCPLCKQLWEETELFEVISLYLAWSITNHTQIRTYTNHVVIEWGLSFCTRCCIDALSLQTQYAICRLPDSEWDSKGTTSRWRGKEFSFQSRHWSHLHQPKFLSTNAYSEFLSCSTV